MNTIPITQKRDLQKSVSSLAKINESGISVFELYGSPVDAIDCYKAEELIKMNYGIPYPKEKFTMLWEMIIENNWSKERLQSVLKWFLKNKKFPTWTIADWFDYDVKLYPYSWYLKNINEGIRADDMEGYKINGNVFWCMKGVDIPLPKLHPGKNFN